MENSKPAEGKVEGIKKILLVEDDEGTRALYLEVLKERGFEVIEAVDGVDGLDKATKEQPDLIFTGIMMPRMDGFAMFEALKKNVATSKIPVAISSHMGREEDQKKAIEVGAKDFIPRDFNTPKQVADRLQSILSANAYHIKINKDDLDAPKLLSDSKISGEMKCFKCGEDMEMVLTRKQELVAKFVCSKCGAEA